MINILFDTSVFFKDPQRKHLGFEVISKLARKKYIKIYIPQIVIDEFITSVSSNGNAFFEEIFKNIEKYKKQYLTTADDIKVIEHLKNKLYEIHNNHISTISNELNIWLKSVFASILEIESHHGKNVIKSYFQKSPTFSLNKERNNFIDAFILEIIQDLRGSFSQLFIISENPNIAKSLKKNNEIEIYNNLEEFISSKRVNKKLFDEFGELYFANIMDYLNTDSSQLEEFLQKKLIDKIAYEQFSINVDLDSVDALIKGVREITQLKFEFENADYYGDGLIGIPISFEADVYIEYFVDPSFINYLQNERLTITSIFMSRDDNDAQIEEEVTITCKSYITLQINDVKTEDLAKEITIEKIVKDSKWEIDSIINLALTT